MSYDSTAGVVGGLLAASALLGMTPGGGPDAPPNVLSARMELSDPQDGKAPDAGKEPAPDAPKDAKAPEGKAPTPAPKDGKAPAPDASKDGKAPEGKAPEAGAPKDGKTPDQIPKAKEPQGASRHGFPGILGKLD